jgi:uncharacterized protein
LNARVNSSRPAADEICLACGLCCNGVIFANLQLQPADDAERLRSHGLPITTSRAPRHPPFLTQPCAALEGCSCRVYADRPQYCRHFECVLLKSVVAGRTQPAEALRIIGAARDRAEKVRRLLRALGDKDEHVALSARFRRTSTRLKAMDLSEETADTYGQLTLAVHDLNLLLGEAFYPGGVRRGA